MTIIALVVSEGTEVAEASVVEVVRGVVAVDAATGAAVEAAVLVVGP